MTEAQSLEAWIASRPPQVRELITLAPPDSLILLQGEVLSVIGYTENDELILADPRLCYDHAKAKRRYLCADHLRNGHVKVVAQ